MNINTKILKDNKCTILFGLSILLILLGGNMLIEANKTPEITSLDSNSSSSHKLVINEIVTNNEGLNIDEEGNLYDWIELYNGTNKDIDLTNYGLSDKENGQIKWVFLSVTIKSKEYLIIYLTGKRKTGLNANFSLKNDGGELITLKSPSGKVVDTIETIELSKNNSMYRDSEGKWKVTEEVTPGYENSKKGRETFLSMNNTQDNTNLQLNEILPVNEGNIAFNKSDLYGYVEIVNNTDSNIDLHDYYLSNDLNILYKWRFPKKELEPSETYLVYTNSLNHENNASFYLKKKTGSVVLSNKNGIVDRYEYNDLTPGVAYIRTGNNWNMSGDISPGYPNNAQGKIDFQKNIDTMKTGLVINEIMSSNSSYLVQNGNQYYDWIELYNNSDKEIKLKNYQLTTERDDIYMYNLPDIILRPNEYYVFMASGNQSLSNNEYTHTNFKLSSGEGLFLYKNEELVDSLFVYGIPKNYSYGRNNTFGHYFYKDATPGFYNGENGIREIAYKPTFNNTDGIYNINNSLEVTLNGNGDIYYTLDGSTPTSSSNKYTNPIYLNDTKVIKAISYENDKASSPVTTQSYIINENHSLPVMSISLNEWDYNSLMYNLYSKNIVDAYVEYYDKDSSFSTTCGLKLFGGQSRQLNKKSFSLEFGNKYAETKLNYKVFDDKNIVEFGDLVLRSGSQDQNSSMIRDEFVSKILVKYGTIIAQDVKPVVLYINGKYWGVYFIREKINPKYIENNFNVKGQTNIIDYLFRAEDGTDKPFVDLRNYIKNHDMRDDKNYEYVSNLLDIDYFIDYYVVQFITNNSDSHNIRYFNNSQLDNGKIKTISFDLDYAFLSDYGVTYIDFLIYHYGLNYPPDSTYLEGLLKNNKFRKRFIERIAYYMNNVWTKEHILEVYDYLYNSIEPEMHRNASRWNQNYDNWNKEVNKLKEQALSRVDEVPQLTKQYFHLSQEEYNEYFNR